MDGKEKKKKSSQYWRYASFLIVLFAIFVWLISGLVNLQLRNSEINQEKAEDTRTHTIALRGKRGSISTADSVVMAEDQLVYNVTFQKDASANSKASYLAYTSSIIEAIHN